MVLKSLLCGNTKLEKDNCTKIAALETRCPGDLRCKGQIGSVCPFCKGMNKRVVFLAIQERGTH